MMDKQKKRSKIYTAAGVATRLIFPFAAMRSSAVLVKNEIGRTKESLKRLRDLARDARRAARDKEESDIRIGSFDAVMDNRSTNALPSEELYRYFLRKKRAALAAALLFTVAAIYRVFMGICNSHANGIVLGLISLMACLPLFFVIALSAQLRLWQLRTRRLSKEEKGGLQDFMREQKSWIADTLNPEWSRKGAK